MININLIAERRARRLRELTILRTTTLLCICFAVIMGLLNLYATIEHVSAKNDVSVINGELAKQKPAYEKLQRVQQEIREREPVVKLLRQVQLSEGAWMTLMADLSAITQRDITIIALGSAQSGSDFTLRISGKARDERTVASFMLAFQSTRWAKTPKLRSLTAEAVSGSGPLEKGLVRFELEVPVRGWVGGDL